MQAAIRAAWQAALPRFGLLLSVLLGSCQPASAWEAYDGQSSGVVPGNAWAKAATPEDLGFSSAALAEARSFSEKVGTTALMIVKDGVVVEAWGEIATKSNVFSGRKSLLSGLIGTEVDAGRIDLSASLADLGIDDNEPALTPSEKRATVGDLIKARSGIYHAALYETPGMTKSKPDRGSHPPGTKWHYNNWDFNTLGTIFEQQSGTGIFEAFKTRFAEPLQMQDYEVTDGDYVRGARSIHPAYPFHMTARDLARFALLYLRQGRWGERQILSQAWIEESTATHSDLGPEHGYGYMWWTGEGRGFFRNLRIAEHSYYASGLGAQYAFVFPHLDLVIVHLVNRERSKRSPSFFQVGRLLWQILAAGGATGLGPDPRIEKAPGRRLAKGDLEDLLSGAKLSGQRKDGKPWELTLSGDGSLSGVAGHGKEDSDSGSWRLQGDRYCRKWQRWAGRRERCYDIVAEGTELRAYDTTGTLNWSGKLLPR